MVSRALRLSIATLVVMLVSACAGKQDQEEPTAAANSGGGEFPLAEPQRNPEDPWEGFNRAIFTFNDGFDRWLFLPVAKGYSIIMPDAFDQGFTNFFSNLLMPVTMINDVLQLSFRDFASNTGRFLLNTTVGVVGFIDVASKVGLEEDPEDFGQTLGYWGVAPGPYVVLPFLGGRTVRDAFGMLPDYAVSVYSEIDNIALRNSLIGLSLIDARADVIPAEQLITGERYLFLRDAYLQQRRYLIADGEIEDDFGEDDFDDQFDDEFEEDSGADFDSDFEQDAALDAEPKDVKIKD